MGRQKLRQQRRKSSTPAPLGSPRQHRKLSAKTINTHCDGPNAGETYGLNLLDETQDSGNFDSGIPCSDEDFSDAEPVLLLAPSRARGTPKVRHNDSIVDAVDALYSSSSSDASDTEQELSSPQELDNSSFVLHRRQTPVINRRPLQPDAAATPAAIGMTNRQRTPSPGKSVQALIKRKVIDHLAMISASSSSDSSIVSDCGEARPR